MCCSNFIKDSLYSKWWRYKGSEASGPGNPGSFNLASNRTIRIVYRFKQSIVRNCFYVIYNRCISTKGEKHGENFIYF